MRSDKEEGGTSTSSFTTFLDPCNKVFSKNDFGGAFGI